MKSTTKWVMSLAVIAAVFFYLPSAWGQLRTHSGAAKSDVEHPKALEKRVFQLTNEARSKNGLPPLDADKALTTVAREKCDEMIKRHLVSQGDPVDKRGLKKFDEIEPAQVGRAAKLGENVHMGSKNDYSDIETAARLIVNGFMGTPANRTNILNPAWTHLGVGVSIKGKESYVTQEFADRKKGK